jgi:anti-sigma regulatory factor (Ser/Thr protein kinase)
MGALRVSAAAFVRPLASETVAGDACLVDTWSRGVVVAAVDGLGHGPAAATAAAAFLDCLRGALAAPLGQTLEAAHRALLKTRGAVATVARFDELAGTVEVAGIGNVTALLASGVAEAKHLVVPAGVLGGAFRTVVSQVVDFAEGDLLVLHTDGVRSRIALDGLRALAPDAIARTIVTKYGRPSDDAGCVVAVGGAATLPRAVPELSRDLDALTIAVRTPGDAECCAVEARRFAARHGFAVKAQWQVGIAVSELATNVLKFAPEGALTVRFAMDPRERIVLEMSDRGRGMADARAAADDGFSEGARLTADQPRRPGQGLGVGLGTVHRMMDDVVVETSPAGTRVVACRYRYR